MDLEKNANNLFEVIQSEFEILQKRVNNSTLMLETTLTTKGYYDVYISCYSSKYGKTIKDTRFYFSIFDDVKEFSELFTSFITSFENNYLKD